MKKIKYSYFALTALIAFNIVLVFLPLTNVLGFEFSLLNGALICLLFGFETLSGLKEALKNKTPIKLFRSGFIYFIIPLIVWAVSALYVKNCSIAEGFLFYLIIVVPSLAVGSAMALFGKFLIKRPNWLGFVILYFAVLLFPLYEFYYYPQIYFYNAVLAYFPGTLFDEALSIEPKFILFRYFVFIFFLPIIYLSAYFIFNSIIAAKIKKITFGVLSIALYILFVFSHSMFGLSTDYNKLEKELLGRITSDNFEIFYAMNISKVSAINIALNAEKDFVELKEYLKTKPSAKIKIYLFYNSDQKMKLLGSGSADIAKPWQNSAFIDYRNYDKTLKHELAHCFSGEFGWSIFKVAYMFNPALIEGIAMAAEDDYDGKPLYYVAGSAYNNGVKLNLAEMFGGYRFLTKTPSLAYVFSGAFSKYLIDVYGIENFKNLYRTLDFNGVYGKNIELLESDFYKFIETFGKDADKSESQYYFGRAPIFKKQCPRFVGSQINKAWELFNEGALISASNKFLTVYLDSKSYQALNGYARVQRKLGGQTELLKFLNSELKHFDSTSYAFPLAFLYGDVLCEMSQSGLADSVYEWIFNNSPNIDYYVNADLKLFLAQDSVAARKYAEAGLYDKYKILRELNANSFLPSAIPSMIEFSRSLNEKYDDFISLFDRKIFSSNVIETYAAYKLSKYAMENLDYERALKYSTIASMHTEDKNLSMKAIILKERAEWIKERREELSKKFKFNN